MSGAHTNHKSKFVKLALRIVYGRMKEDKGGE